MTDALRPAPHVPVRFTIWIGGAEGSWERAQEAARAAEAAGAYGIALADHIGYPPGRYIIECMSLATALASCTSKIKIVIAVAALTFREPAMLAKMATALDIVSGGRAELGIGVGIRPSEHEMFGIPYPSDRERVSRLAEYVQVVKLLCAPNAEAVNFDGRFYQLRGARNLPAPTHAIPIAIGGGGDRILGIVARYADTWDCPDTYLDRHVERSAKLDELLRVTGRPVVRSLQVPMAVQPLSAELLSYRPTLGLGAFGEPARMVERVRELAGGAHYDQLALEPIGAQSFYRALEMLPAFAEALTR